MALQPLLLYSDCCAAVAIVAVAIDLQLLVLCFGCVPSHRWRMPSLRQYTGSALDAQPPSAVGVHHAGCASRSPSHIGSPAFGGGGRGPVRRAAIGDRIGLVPRGSQAGVDIIVEIAQNYGWRLLAGGKLRLQAFSFSGAKNVEHVAKYRSTDFAASVLPAPDSPETRMLCG